MACRNFSFLFFRSRKRTWTRAVRVALTAEDTCDQFSISYDLTYLGLKFATSFQSQLLSTWSASEYAWSPCVVSVAW